MNFGPGELFLLIALLGVITGAAGYSWRPTVRNFWRFFALGVILPIVGLFIALAIKKSVPARAAAR